MQIGSYVVFFMIAAIVMVSIMVTYNLIVSERLREIGTLRSIGLHRMDIAALFLFEGVYLLLFAIAAGGLVSLLIRFGISRITFDWIPGFSLFLEDGRLWGRYRPDNLVMNTGLLALILFASIGFPIRRALKRSVVQCLKS